jgi:hypothetical protein
MKKIILATIVVLFALTSSAQSMCKGCSVASTTQSASFNPTIFQPVPIGSYARQTAYLKSAPRMSLPPIMITAYIYMQGTDGKVVEMAISGNLVNVPSDWNGTYYGTKDGPPVQYPLPIPILVKMNPHTTPDGRAILDANGQPTGRPEITF